MVRRRRRAVGVAARAVRFVTDLPGAGAAAVGGDGRAGVQLCPARSSSHHSQRKALTCRRRGRQVIAAAGRRLDRAPLRAAYEELARSAQGQT